MDKKMSQKLVALSSKTGQAREDLRDEILRSVKNKLAARKYRADLSIMTAAKSTAGKFSAEIRFNPRLGHPSEQDILTLVAQNYPTHQVDWQLIDVDQNSGIVTLMLEPSVEVIPIESMKAIPPEFSPIGTAMYKRAADASGKVNEIWQLKRTDEGLALFRSPNDLEITAEDEGGFKAGDVVNTPYGPGRVERFDDTGDCCYVLIGNKRRLVAASDLKKYDVDKERKKLEEYYAMAYGDADFASSLVKKIDKK